MFNFDDIQQKLQQEMQSVTDLQSLEAFRIQFLGRKGLIKEIYSSLGKLSAEEKSAVGQKANELRARIETFIQEKKESLEQTGQQQDKFETDPTLPGIATPVGHQHLLTKTMDDICRLFENLGFVIYEGPEVETEEHNFEGLNIPEDHPSRDGFDTFYLNHPDPDDESKSLLLRSHTSPGQIRIMKAFQPPFAVIIPGRVYRPDAVDASHSFMFHQIEGLLVGENIKFSDLKGLLQVFCQRFFGSEVKMRFRPHYFPFTEPSAEVDISSTAISSKDWLEIMGCGMVHPNVFRHVGYEDGKYTGLAFGMGVERIAMLKHGIRDIRTFYENDKRFLEQF